MAKIEVYRGQSTAEYVSDRCQILFIVCAKSISKSVPFRIISDYGFIVINSAFLIMGTNQILFDALTLAVSNKDIEEFSNTCAQN